MKRFFNIVIYFAIVFALGRGYGIYLDHIMPARLAEQDQWLHPRPNFYSLTNRTMNEKATCCDCGVELTPDDPDDRCASHAAERRHEDIVDAQSKGN